MSLPEPDSFLSGDAGDVTSPLRLVKRTLGEAAFELADRAAGIRRAAGRLAARQAPRRVLVLGVYRPRPLLVDSLDALHSEHHQVRLALGATAEPDPLLAEWTLAEGLEGGKFENLNRLLEMSPGSTPTGRWWSTTTSRLPHPVPRPLPRPCAEAFGPPAGPARARRCAATPPGRWRAGARSRSRASTRFVEIGPVTAFGPEPAAELLPFPELRFGWGLDLHWAALAGQQNWRLGVVDAVPVRHEDRARGRGLLAATRRSKRRAAFSPAAPTCPPPGPARSWPTHRRIR